MKQNTRMWINGNEVEIPEFMCCSRKCDGTTSHSLVYDGDQDGTPDNITSDGNIITITPTDLSVGECDSTVVYALQNDITGVSLNSTNAAISIDCGIASQESCDLMILVDTLCDGTVIGTRSMNIVLTCGGCDEDCDDTVHLSWNADGSLYPQHVTYSQDKCTATITPHTLENNCECANITYNTLDGMHDGVTIDPKTGVLTVDCKTAPKTLQKVSVFCEDTKEVIANVPVYITNICGECDEDEDTQLDYDGDDDGVPDNISSNDTTVTVTPIELQTVGCENGVITYVLNPEETPDGATIDENTGVISIDCQLIATANTECSVRLDVYPRCDGHYIVVDGVEQHTIINVPLSDYCTAECVTQETQLDYDGDNDGVPDTVTIDGDIITITPVDLDTGHCVAPNHIVYSLPTRGTPDGVTIDPTTGVITIDCSLIGTNVCELNLTVNTECVEQ